MTGSNLHCRPTPRMSGKGQNNLQTEVLVDESGQAIADESDRAIKTDNGLPPPPE